MKKIRLENRYYRIEVEPKCGVIRSVVDKAGGYDLIVEKRLAENFRLLLPLPDMQANYILGREQRLSAVRQLPEALELRWNGPLVNERGRFAVAVTLWIELVGEAVHFRCRVKNRTAHPMSEIWCPVLGGLMGLGRGEERQDTQVLIPHAFDQIQSDLFRKFGGQFDLGIAGAESAWAYPGWMPMPWVSFFHEKLERGFYFAAHEPTTRARVFRVGMEPGAASGRVGGDWPTAEEVGRLPMGVLISWTFVPYIGRGETFENDSVVLQAHAGGWRRSAAVYRDWFTATFPIVDSSRDWLRRETAFLDTMFMLPEDNINLRFTDIPRWARTAARHGIGSVMISGWQIGGHDRGYPQYTPDPRLGTWEELAAGVRACHKLGLRVYFFVNILPADVTLPWYRRELHKYVVQDNTGNPYFLNGFGMGTLSARRGLTRPTLVEMNPAHPKVRALHVRQIRKLAEIGADGVHIDKIVPAPMDFNPKAPGGPDNTLFEGVLQTVDEIMRVCRKINPEFCISYESNFDRLMAFSDVCWWGDVHAAVKEVFPQWTGTMAANQPYAYNMVNQAVLRARNILIGPSHYTKDMNDPPMRKLNRYIAEVTRIRRELVDVVSRGAVVAASEPPFVERNPPLRLGGSFAKSPDARWTLYRDVQTGRRAVVLANLGRKALTATVALTGGTRAACRVYQPFEEMRPARMPVRIALPAERVAVAVEEV